MLSWIPPLHDNEEDVWCWLIIYKYSYIRKNQLYHWTNLCSEKVDTNFFETDFQKIVGKTYYRMHFYVP